MAVHNAGVVAVCGRPAGRPVRRPSGVGASVASRDDVDDDGDDGGDDAVRAGYAAAAIRHALDRTGTTPADIDYVCAHGTSTKINDVTETRAIRDALGPRADNVAVSSPKSLVGHMIGAAG